MKCVSGLDTGKQFCEDWGATIFDINNFSHLHLMLWIWEGNG
jgi:hypothetical protein